MSSALRVESLLLISGPAGALVRDDQPHHGVQQETRAAEEGQHDEQHPQDGRVDVEVPGQPACDAGDLAVGGAATELPVVLEVVGVPPVGRLALRRWG